MFRYELRTQLSNWITLTMLPMMVRANKHLSKDCIDCALDELRNFPIKLDSKILEIESKLREEKTNGDKV